MNKTLVFAVSSALLGLALPAASAQTADDPAQAATVSWTVQSQSDVAPGSKLALTLQGTVQEGWHVYGLKQLPDGPTPLFVALDANPVAVADGAPKASAPTKLRDPSFGLVTQFYAQPFSVTVPVRIAAHSAAGQQVIPLSVRFQTCNGRICQPPKTVHLSATVSVRPTP